MGRESARFWAAFCMGIWLMGTVATAVVAAENFFTAGRLLQAQPHPKFIEDVERLGFNETHDLLWYLSSELNRLYFQYWNIVQLALGILTLWLVVKIPGADKPKWGIVAMLGIVLFLTALITPQMVSVGREIDFIPHDPPPPGLRTFGLLHAAYTVFDGIQVILGVLVVVWLAKPKEI